MNTIDLTEDERAFLANAIRGSTAPCDPRLEEELLKRLEEARPITAVERQTLERQRDLRLKNALDALQGLTQQMMRGDMSLRTANFYVATQVLLEAGRRPRP